MKQDKPIITRRQPQRRVKDLGIQLKKGGGAAAIVLSGRS
jgi:hypothetical protein